MELVTAIRHPPVTLKVVPLVSFDLKKLIEKPAMNVCKRKSSNESRNRNFKLLLEQSLESVSALKKASKNIKLILKLQTKNLIIF
jgi:hypothetical protein